MAPLGTPNEEMESHCVTVTAWSHAASGLGWVGLGGTEPYP